MAKTLRLLVVVSVSLLFLYWHSSTLLWQWPESAPLDLGVGDRICLPIFAEARDGGQDLFIISTDSLCPFCEAAKPFEVALEEFGAGVGIRTMYLINDRPVGEPLAEKYEAAGKAVIRARAADVAYV
jgi:hypothetical protein